MALLIVCFRPEQKKFMRITPETSPFTSLQKLETAGALDTNHNAVFAPFIFRAAMELKFFESAVVTETPTIQWQSSHISGDGISYSLKGNRFIGDKKQNAGKPT